MTCPVLELTQQLIKCRSVSPEDAGCQELLIERLQAIGFTIEDMTFGDTRNFWAYRGVMAQRLHSPAIPTWYQAGMNPNGPIHLMNQPCATV